MRPYLLLLFAFLVALSLLQSCQSDEPTGTDTVVPILDEVKYQFMFQPGTWWTTIDSEGVKDSFSVQGFTQDEHFVSERVRQPGVRYNNTTTWPRINLTIQQNSDPSANIIYRLMAGMYMHGDEPVYATNFGYFWTSGPFNGFSHKRLGDVQDTVIDGRIIDLLYKSRTTHVYGFTREYLVEPHVGLISQVHRDSSNVITYWRTTTDFHIEQ